eukprot:scaffold63471_cov32-Attheya_sp.AAC.2
MGTQVRGHACIDLATARESQSVVSQTGLGRPTVGSGNGDEAGERRHIEDDMISSKQPHS